MQLKLHLKCTTRYFCWVYYSLFFISTYFSVAALNPIPASFFFTSFTTIAGSSPAFILICLIGSSKALSIIFPPILSSASNSATAFQLLVLHLYMLFRHPLQFLLLLLPLLQIVHLLFLVFLFHFYFSCCSNTNNCNSTCYFG